MYQKMQTEQSYVHLLQIMDIESYNDLMRTSICYIQIIWLQTIKEIFNLTFLSLCIIKYTYHVPIIKTTT